MTKRTSAKYKIDRRMGENIWGRPKSPVNKREYGPGQHGQRRKGKMSDFGTQLKAKQKLKGYYANLSERQFRKTYDEANRLQGPTGENLLRLLELRLDNVVFRAGFASTRPQARQFVSHGLILVNGKRLDIPSARVKKGDVITLAIKAQEMIVIQHNVDTLDRSLVGWLEGGDGGKQVTVRNEPARENIDVPVREQLIVELYSK